MKHETKLQFVEDWRTNYGVAATATLTEAELDSMWKFAERKQNNYEGLAKYCARFDDTFLAKITKRARMRALLEVRVPAIKDMGRLPSADRVREVTLPQYIGTGTRGQGSRMIPMTDGAGGVTDEGQSLMLAQALLQMRGHKARYEIYMSPATAKTMDRYIARLLKESDSAAVNAHAAAA